MQKNGYKKNGMKAKMGNSFNELIIWKKQWTKKKSERLA